MPDHDLVRPAVPAGSGRRRTRPLDRALTTAIGALAVAVAVGVGLSAPAVSPAHLPAAETGR